MKKISKEIQDISREADAILAEGFNTETKSVKYKLKEFVLNFISFLLISATFAVLVIYPRLFIEVATVTVLTTLIFVKVKRKLLKSQKRRKK